MCKRKACTPHREYAMDQNKNLREDPESEGGSRILSLLFSETI